jgi:hypothetical protein
MIATLNTAAALAAEELNRQANGDLFVLNKVDPSDVALEWRRTPEGCVLHNRIRQYRAWVQNGRTELYACDLTTYDRMQDFAPIARAMLTELNGDIQAVRSRVRTLTSWLALPDHFKVTASA